MKTEKNIFIAFLLNLAFSIFEFMGGLLTGSVAIASDAVHDLGDAFSIGLSWVLEKKSKRAGDGQYTYGYGRYSVLGSCITTLVLIFGSAVVIYHAVLRILHPTPIHYEGMILFALIGVGVNLGAALLTRHGDSLNQKAVNLHMLEDVLGWLVVLAGAVIMRFADITLLDPLMSIAVALFILVHAIKNLKESVDLFLEKAPQGLDLCHLQACLLQIEGVADVHHLHLWSIDGTNHCATMHIVTNRDPHTVKTQVRRELEDQGIHHATLELETEGEHCNARHCHSGRKGGRHHHH